jgi:hypothetical protein
VTRACCPACRLRFSRATAVHLAACPFCGEPLATLAAASALGFRLMTIEPPDGAVDEVAVALAALVPESPSND